MAYHQPPAETLFCLDGVDSTEAHVLGILPHCCSAEVVKLLGGGTVGRWSGNKERNLAGLSGWLWPKKSRLSYSLHCLDQQSSHNYWVTSNRLYYNCYLTSPPSSESLLMLQAGKHRAALHSHHNSSVLLHCLCPKSLISNVWYINACSVLSQFPTALTEYHRIGHL